MSDLRDEQGNRIFKSGAGSDQVRQEGRAGKYLHLLENGQVGGQSVYILLRRFEATQRAAMEKWVEKYGFPVWLVESDVPNIAQATWGAYGHSGAKFWNSGAGWQVGPMVGRLLVPGVEYPSWVIPQPVVKEQGWQVKQVLTFAVYGTRKEAEEKVEELREEWARGDAGELPEWVIEQVELGTV